MTIKNTKQLGSQCNENTLHSKTRVASRVNCEFVSGRQGFESCDCRLFLRERKLSELSRLQGGESTASSARLGMSRWVLMIFIRAETSGRRLENVDCPADEK